MSQKEGGKWHIRGEAALHSPKTVQGAPRNSNCGPPISAVIPVTTFLISFFLLLMLLFSPRATGEKQRVHTTRKGVCGKACVLFSFFCSFLVDTAGEIRLERRDGKRGKTPNKKNEGRESEGRGDNHRSPVHTFQVLERPRWNK